MTTQRTLILGATGLLGRAFLNEFRAHSVLLSPSRQELDLTDLNAVKTYLEQHQPQVIINAAAFTGIERNIEQPELAMRINSELPRVLGQYVRGMQGAVVVHFSCASVYGNSADGRRPKGAVLQEDDPTQPATIYAQTKLQGELSLQSNCANYMIFRLSGLYDERIFEQSEQPERIFAGAPTSASYVANTICRTLSRIDRKVLKLTPGIFNLCAKGSADWSLFFREASTVKDRQSLLQSKPVDNLMTFGDRLSVDKAEGTFCLFVPSWQAQLHSVLANLRSDSAEG